MEQQTTNVQRSIETSDEVQGYVFGRNYNDGFVFSTLAVMPVIGAVAAPAFLLVRSLD